LIAAETRNRVATPSGQRPAGIDKEARLRVVHALAAVALGTALVAGATALAGSSASAVRKQRIALDMVINRNDTGTFTLSPLTPGPLEADKGTVAIPGAGGGTTLRNGMTVMSVGMGQELKGRHGTFGLPVQFDQNEMQNGVYVSVGTWKIVKGTGAYSGVSGSGRYVSVRMPNGRQLVRQEGWIKG
jgi:hypothetical protein